MKEKGAIKASCENEGCHPADQLAPGNITHDMHLDRLDCSSCHVKTVMACNSCHFETKVATDADRYYGEVPDHDFILLVNSEAKGKVTTATYQSLTYGDSGFYAIAPSHGHTVTLNSRMCWDCHNNETALGYLQNGEIVLTKWDGRNNYLKPTKGVIPVPPDWRTSFKIDFVTYTGSATDPVDEPFLPEKWRFLKSGADGAQMLFAQPLSESQMNKLASMPTGIEYEHSGTPEMTKLYRNYPNPFNPQTKISYQIPVSSDVELVVYNSLGMNVATLVRERQAAGVYHILWDASGLASGIYFYRLKAENFSQIKKMILIK